MPQDLNKAAAVSKTSTQQPTRSTLQQEPSTDESLALATLAQTTAGTIRKSVGAMSQLADQMQQQRELVADHAADRLSQILDPASIQAEIAVRTLQKLEGKDFLPFALEPIELPEVPRYVPQLPASYVAQSLPSLPSGTIDVSESETTCNGNSKVEPGKGFGVPRDRS